jgi:hypothetical protein
VHPKLPRSIVIKHFMKISLNRRKIIKIMITNKNLIKAIIRNIKMTRNIIRNIVTAKITIKRGILRITKTISRKNMMMNIINSNSITNNSHLSTIHSQKNSSLIRHSLNLLNSSNHNNRINGKN